MAETLSNVVNKDGDQGVYTATYVNTDGAAAYFYPGFVPKVVIVINITTAEINFWIRGMAAGSHLGIILASAYAATNGVTVGTTADGTATALPFIKLGTDILNANETVKILAF
jgi:hypothetical protein